jgi:hypothetical protein
MNRREFFSTMIGGVAAASAVRTWPFRVFSFPSEIITPNFDLITAATLESLRDEILYDTFFVNSPWMAKLKQRNPDAPAHP